MLCGETAAAAKRSGLNAIRAFYGRSQQETAPRDGFFRGLSVRQFCLARCGACRPVAAGSVAGAHCAACGALFCTGALRPLMLMRVMRPCSPLMRIRTRAGCEFCSFMVFLRLFRVLDWCTGKRVFSPSALAMGGFRGCLQFILDVAATRFCTISGYQVVKTYSFSPHPNPSHRVRGARSSNCKHV